MFQIRPAVPTDLAALTPLVSRAVAHMLEWGNPQWGEDYPTMPLFEQDIAQGELFAAVDENDTLLGVVCLNQEESPEYEDVTWLQSGPALVVHRMVVDPAFQSQGVGQAFFAYIDSQARELGLKHIKADSYSLNTAMLTLLQKMGFVRVGQVFFTPDERPLPFPCFEKLL